MILANENTSEYLLGDNSKVGVDMLADFEKYILEISGEHAFCQYNASWWLVFFTIAIHAGVTQHKHFPSLHSAHQLIPDNK